MNSIFFCFISIRLDIETSPYQLSAFITEKDRLSIKPATSNVAVNQFRAADLTLSPEVYNHLRVLQKKTKDLKSEVKTLRRLAQTQTISIREDIKDTFMRIRATLLVTNINQWGQFDQERVSIGSWTTGVIITDIITKRSLYNSN